MYYYKHLLVIVNITSTININKINTYIYLTKQNNALCISLMSDNNARLIKQNVKCLSERFVNMYLHIIIVMFVLLCYYYCIITSNIYIYI